MIVKIGGSVIFGVDNAYLKELLTQTTKFTDIIVTGCGSEAHDVVLKTGLTDKPAENKYDRITEFLNVANITQKKLNWLIELIQPTKFKPVHPSSLFVKNSVGGLDHEIVYFNKKLTNGKIITSGGVVLDENLLATAISSDTIGAYIATRLGKTPYIIFSDTAVVNNGKIVQNININNIPTYIFGGMKDKIRRVKFCVEQGIEVAICNATKMESVKATLQGDFSECTILNA